MSSPADLKVCPYCAEDIKAAAIKCRYCHSDLSGDQGRPAASDAPRQREGRADQPSAAPTEVRAQPLPRLGPRDWWVYLELQTPRTLDDLMRASDGSASLIGTSLETLESHGLARSEVDGDDSRWMRDRQLTTAQLGEVAGLVERADLKGPMTSSVASLDPVEPPVGTSHSPARRESSAERRRRAMGAAGIEDDSNDKEFRWSDPPKPTSQVSKAERRAREDEQRSRRRPQLPPVEYEVNVAKFQAEDSFWRKSTHATVRGDVHNRSGMRCSYNLTFQFVDKFGSSLATCSLAVSDVAPWASQSWQLDFDADNPKPWGSLAKRVTVQTEVTAAHADERAGSHRAAMSRPSIPLLDWRGMGFMTRTPSVAAACAKCSHEWRIKSEVTNTIAQEQGLGGRLQRWGTAMEQTGATFTLGASGRRIAAGNERQRQEEGLVALYRMAACPRCGATDVLLAKS